jgi:hypothetical protein
VATAGARAVGLPSVLRPAIAALAAVLLLLPTGVAEAQEDQTAGVELRLLRQTPAATPRRALRIAVEATNDGAARLRDLTMSLWVYHPARSRSTYHQGLEGEPPTAPLLIDSFRQRGALGRGESRTIAISRRLPELAAEAENALYPVKVQLESEGVPVAVLRTVLPFIQERPLVPLNLSLTFVLAEDVPFRPDGTFLSSSLEAAVVPDGSLDSVVSALERSQIRATLAISPLLLEHLRSMQGGYRIEEQGTVREVAAEDAGGSRAEQLLQRIRALARSPSTEVLALPYAGASVAGLVASGLAEDLEHQLERGRQVMESILGVEASDTVLYPPGSEVSPESIAALERLGVETLVVSPEALRAPGELVLSPDATAVIHRTSMHALAPDPDLAAYLEPPPDDPRLRAQQLVGELAAIYFERPSEVRGAAILFDEKAAPSPSFLRAFLQALSDPPPDGAWLQPRTATQLLASVPPEDGRRLRGRNPDLLPAAVVARVRETRQTVDEFRGMVEESPLVDRLLGLVLAAEGRRFQGREEEALAFLDAVHDALTTEFGKIEPPADLSVTLTSQGGVIPVTLRNETGYPVRLRVVLLSPRLDFLEGSARDITLDGEAHSLTFPVRAQTTGRFPVTVLVETPAGRTIAESQILVRSTAYNRVALGVTAGAAVFLALWWGRRFWRRAAA